MIIISGGQTGADMGGIYAAEKHEIPVEGWAPKGWMTEDGPKQLLLDTAGLKEHADGYAARTRANVEMADAVLILGNIQSTGSRLTMNTAVRRCVPWLALSWRPGEWGWPPKWQVEPWAPTDASAIAVAIWLRDIGGVERLMIAGNRESKNPGIGEAVFELMDRVFGEMS